MIVGIIFISLTLLIHDLSLLSAGILFIALSSIIEHQRVLIRKNDLIIHYLKLNQSIDDDSDHEVSSFEKLDT